MIFVIAKAIINKFLKMIKNGKNKILGGHLSKKKTKKFTDWPTKFYQKIKFCVCLSMPK